MKKSEKHFLVKLTQNLALVLVATCLNSSPETSLGLGVTWWGKQASKQGRKSSMEVTMATLTQPTTQAPVTLRSSVENLHTYSHPPPHTYQQGGRARGKNLAIYTGNV